MKRLYLSAVAVFIIALFPLPSVSAFEVPYLYEFDILDVDTGLGKTGLSCNYTDGLFNISSSEVAVGRYTVLLNDSYYPSTYSYILNCSDGEKNSVYTGSFQVDESYVGSPESVVPELPEDDRGVFSYIRQNPWTGIAALIVVAGSASLLGGKKNEI